MKNLNKKSIKKLISAALKQIEKNGSNFYGWQNAPIVKGNKITHTSGWGDSETKLEISTQEAFKIYESKLNGAYGERFAMTVAMLPGLIENGYSVSLVQFAQEKGIPFNANGWLVVIVESMPIFHISPDDLSGNDVEEMVNILCDNQHTDVCWKKTDKVGEFNALLQGSVEPGLDLVKIAQSF